MSLSDKFIEQLEKEGDFVLKGQTLSADQIYTREKESIEEVLKFIREHLEYGHFQEVSFSIAKIPGNCWKIKEVNGKM